MAITQWLSFERHSPGSLAAGPGGGWTVPGRGVDRWQVLTLRDGMVADILGFDNRAEAAAAAGL